MFDTLQDNNRNIVTWYKHTGFILESIKTLDVDEVQLYSCCFFFSKLSSHSGGTHNTI